MASATATEYGEKARLPGSAASASYSPPARAETDATASGMAPAEPGERATSEPASSEIVGRPGSADTRPVAARGQARGREDGRERDQPVQALASGEFHAHGTAYGRERFPRAAPAVTG